MSVPRPDKRVVLITGAAGGLGQALVAAFLNQDWRVAAGRHRAPLPARAAGTALHPVVLDVTNAAQCQAAVADLTSKWGRLDLLINNAGLTADELSWRIPEADWDRVIDVNLKGAFLCSQAALRLMLAQHDGHIINLGSFAARSGPRGQASYAAAKAGLIGLTQSLAREVGSRNIRVNAVLPGVLPTPLTAALTDSQRLVLIDANVLRRWNDPAEVARFIAFLAGLQNVSGQVFQLDSRLAPWT